MRRILVFSWLLVFAAMWANLSTTGLMYSFRNIGDTLRYPLWRCGVRTTLLLLLVLVLTVATALVPRPNATSANPLTGVSAVVAGGSHTCAVTATVGVKCWGDNSSGQLGDGTTTSRSTPADVLRLGIDSATVAAGGFHTCALSTAGAVRCWGNNLVGQVGDGTNTDRNTPVDVPELASHIAAIAAGFNHSCALTTAGTIKCWGQNVFGQLGDETTTDRTAPVDVVGLSSGVAAVATGGGHTCALTTTGGVKCWGDNIYGGLGAATTEQCGPFNNPCSTTPVDVVDLSDVTAVAAGVGHTCALTAAGSVTCWGNNTYGQLGDGSTTNSAVPVNLSGLTGEIVSISTGSFHTCALTLSGGLKCWGNNDFGQLGDNTTTDRTTPVSVSGLTSGVAALAVGNAHTCALMTEGGVKCWGYNSSGRLGDGTNIDRPTPVDVMELSKAPSGDVNCNGSVNSIDAALVLQFIVGLTPSLNCQADADVNENGDVNSIDAAIILQFVAGLIPGLPV